jgi:hydroxymethylpyrimidine/phosphomethylpyrimidine kinase
LHNSSQESVEKGTEEVNSSVSFKAMKTAEIARKTCIEGLKNQTKTHVDVAQDVYNVVIHAIDGDPCIRCGGLMNGTGGHGPGRCKDGRENAEHSES